MARRDGVVVLFSSSLSDTLATVHVIERRLGYATLAALAIALVLGSVAAALHARRIRRLERAAERIAQGAFDEPVRDTGDDELGELARTFERMRIQLSRLDSARRAFVATASHELRTPLFALGGFIELLEDEDLDEETRRGFLTTMREQVDRLTKLATDLLDLSRVDAGDWRSSGRRSTSARSYEGLRGSCAAWPSERGTRSRSMSRRTSGRSETRTGSRRSAAFWRGTRLRTRPAAPR